ncbi:MarR family winged helix-turn-helix transcriptional regulator [Streptomyces sp. NPDC005908]|uniref:MarR family winged helix-turn-helix transcriptional regulator n=1 Tax=Streptomyces sp. NPDC005908 TaxID=3157084 RepID=UPI0033E525E7
MGEAATALLMKPDHVSALVSRLGERGELERRQDAADKRIAHLHLTTVSRRRIAEMRALVERLPDGALAPSPTARWTPSVRRSVPSAH